MDILGYLKKGLDVVQNLAEVAKELDLPVIGDVAAIASTVTNVAENVLKRVDEGKVVMSSDDQQAVKQIITDLQAENDALNEYITTH